METIKETGFSLQAVLASVRSFFSFLFSRWWLILLTVAVGGGLGLVYHSMQRPKYEATTTFILEDKSSGGGGGLAGIASQFGLNLGGLSSGSIFTGDNILDILRSKTIIQQVLLSKVGDAGTGDKTLGDLYLDFSGARKGWAQKKPQLATIRLAEGKSGLTPLQDSVLNIIYESLIKNHLVTERTSKQGTIIKVKVTAGNSAFARLLAERLVEESSKLYLNLRVGTATENIRQLQRRSDSLLVLLNAKSYRAAASQLLDINPGIRTATVPVEIANRDKTVIATLYAEVTKNLEASKLLLSQQTPVIQLLDRPGFLLDDHKKGRLFLLVVGGFLGGVLFTGGAFLFFLLFGPGRTKMKKEELNAARVVVVNPQEVKRQ